MLRLMRELLVKSALLNGKSRQVAGFFHKLNVFGLDLLRLARVERKGSQHFTRAVENGQGGTGMEATQGRKGAEVLRGRMRGNVINHHELPGERCGSADTTVQTDPQTLHGLREYRGRVGLAPVYKRPSRRSRTEHRVPGRCRSTMSETSVRISGSGAPSTVICRMRSRSRSSCSWTFRAVMS